MARSTDVGAGNGAQDAKGEAVRRARRRLLKGGLAAAPVALTIASGPVLAGKAYTASARASAPLSGTPRGQYDCYGRSPSSWCTKVNNSYSGWPCSSGSQYHGTMNYQVSGSQCGTKAHTKIMNSWCGMNGETSNVTSLNKLAAHCSASLLNCEKGLIDSRVLTKQKIQDIWNACAVNNGTGTWSPGTGVTWNVNQVCDWLATTWS